VEFERWYGPTPDYVAAALWSGHDRGDVVLDLEHDDTHSERRMKCRLGQRFRFLRDFLLPPCQRCESNASSGASEGGHMFQYSELTLRFLHDSQARWTPATPLAFVAY
jgi:hypothetical protein